MTNLVYLDDTYAFEGTGIVMMVGRDEKGGYLVFDQTVFYPQGGGQPADKGTIRLSGNEIPVIFVGYQNGEVRHYVPEEFVKETYVGQGGEFNVNGTYRLSNARLHTGGHHISHVLETLNPNLIPIKGYHFPDGSYVEFVNDMGVDVGPLIQSANERLDSDVKKDLPILSELSTYDVIADIRPELAPFTPKDKPSRVVTIGDYKSLPCGGTHVRKLGEIGSITITKFKKQKSNVRISYMIK